MRKIGHIATREFLGTVLTKGFLIGVLMTPALLAIGFAALPRLMSQRGVAVRGEVAIVDPTGEIAPELRLTIAPQAIASRRKESARRLLANAPAPIREVAGRGSADAALNALGSVPELTVVERPGGDLQADKAWLIAAPPNAPRRLALIAVHADAVRETAGQDDLGVYDIYVPAGLDDRVETTIYESVRDAIVNVRLSTRHMDRRAIESLVRVQRPQSITLTRGNEQATVGVFNRVLPMAFAGVMLIGVLLGGQGLVTSTVEEKSSRVVEVLLSAVSPLELMAGKILGQMAVGAVVLGIYIALGLLTLWSFAMVGLIEPMLVVYLVIFYVISYLTIGSLMAAAGAAVSEMREAQHLVMPVIIVMMIPWVLAVPIAREPNSAWSTAISFVPPINTFAMLLRLTSTAPPPTWQVWLSIAVAIASVLAAIWFAAKVFRIGLLMYGKPPDLATLVRWARSA